MLKGAITIGREFGSGGRFVARKVAEMLNIPFYDRELILMVAEKTGLSPEFVKKAEEQRSSGFLYSLHSPTNALPLNDQVFIAQSNIIKSVAAEGPCVIVGRCADYVLSNVPGCLDVFIHAPLDQKIERCRKYYSIEGTDAEIKKIIAKHDRSRASYYNNFTMQKWGTAQNYDMTITTALGIEAAALAIVAVYREVGSD